MRETRLGHGIETSFHDVRDAFRALGRSPGFTAVVIATLALAIGASLTMFSLVRSVLWRPLPYPEPDRIVVIQVDARNRVNVGATLGEVLDLKERSRSFERVSMIDPVSANLEYQGETDRVSGANVSDNFLRLLGVRPALGRMLDSRIDQGVQQPRAVLISDELWRGRFSADPGILGRGVRIDDTEMRIVGVLPPGFRLFLPASSNDSEKVDVWFPWRMSPVRRYRGVPVVARLRSGVSLGRANAELETLAAQFEREYPDFYVGPRGWQASPFDSGSGVNVRFTARPLQDEMTREARPALFLLCGAVALALLIACVNVANLMLARGSARQRELAIRRALGAGRFRIIRQLFTESLVLAVASSVVGLFLTRSGLAAIGRLSASHIPLQSRIGMDASVTLFALALSIVTSLIFGLLPAWRMTSGRADRPLRAGRAQTAGSGARKLQRTLVMVEIALSIVPLACGGLMLRSFLNLLHSPLGFDPINVITARLNVPIDPKKYPKADQRWGLLRDILDRLRAIPGVESVSAAEPLPLASNQQMRRVGRADQPDAPPILASQQGAAPGCLGVIGATLLEGRDFTEADIVTARRVAIIDERLAKRLWPEGALGQRISVYRTGWRDDLEIVGVTTAVRAARVRDDNIPNFIMADDFPMSLVMKTREGALSEAAIRRAVDAGHAGRAVYDIRPMSDYVSDSIGDTRFVLFILAAFAGVSVLLAAVGLYGTLAYLTAQRTREFGIRLALGSSARAIIAMVLWEGVWLAIAGLSAGLLGAMAVTRAIRNLLYGVRPLDTITLLGVAGLLGMVAVLAAGIPAWRAARVDPQASLRVE